MALEGQDLPRTHLTYHEESVIIILLPSETKSQRCGGVDRGCHGSHSCDEHMQGTFIQQASTAVSAGFASYCPS